jgi:hypothetical protein
VITRGVDAEPARHLAARVLRVLRGAPEGGAAVVAPLGGGGAGLQRGGGEPLVDQLPRDDDLAAVEEVRVELLVVVEAVGGVGARVGEEQHLVGGGGLEVDDDRQRVVVDLDQVGGVLPLVGLLGEDGGDRLADEPHHVLRQELAHHLVVRPAEQQRRREVDVGAGEHADDAGRRAGLPDVDRLDAGVCEWRPDEREMQRSDQVEVVGVAGAAREEGRILHAHDARAHDAHRLGA